MARTPRCRRFVLVPRPEDFDKTITLDQILEPGDDENRFSNSKVGQIVGYVKDVRMGGVESCNCNAKDALYRNTHIELVRNPSETDKTKRMVVEVTPRWREIMKRRGNDWTTTGLRTKILGRWVKVQGWMFFDVEYKNGAENTNPGDKGNWRATAWEIHPVTRIDLVDRPK